MTLVIEEWDATHSRWPDLREPVAAEQQRDWLAFTAAFQRSSHMLVAQVDGILAGWLRFVVQEIGPDAGCPPICLQGVALTEAKVLAFAVVPAHTAPCTQFRQVRPIAVSSRHDWKLYPKEGKDAMPVLSAATVVVKGGQVLLILREDFPIWCLPCGAVEPEESVPQAAMREVQEETGLAVALTSLVGLYSRPRWFHGDHLAVFRAHPIGGTLRPDPREARDARFFAPTDLPRPSRPSGSTQGQVPRREKSAASVKREDSSSDILRAGNNGVKAGS